MAVNDLVVKLQNSILVRVVGGVAVLAIVGGFAAMKFFPHDASQDAPTAMVHHAKAHHPAGNALSAQAGVASNVNATGKSNAAGKASVAANVPAPVSNGVVNASAVSARNRGASRVAVASHAGAGDGSGAPVVTGVGQPIAANTAHLDEHLTYQYNALGRRDPFQSLVDGQFVGADVGGEAPPDPGGIKVVGIVWGATDQFALVEDVRGNSFVLRKGDKVQNGVVEGLKRDGVVINITADGQSQSVVIPLTRKGEQNAR